MKKIILTICGLFVFYAALFSQNRIENVLTEIENNNTTLAALRKKTDAEKLGNKTGIFLQNPEVEYGYLWGNPSAIGNRTDVSVTQSFDFPTAYKYKNQISDFKNEQVELEYLKQKKELLLNAKIILNNLVYTNALKAELENRKTLADSISAAYKRKLDVGETSILEFNKAKITALSAQKELEVIEIEQTSLLAELTALNGGKPVEFSEKSFQPLVIPGNFEQWYQEAEQKNPVLAWLKQEIEISQNREKLEKAMSLPKLQTGYMSEKTEAEHFQGVTVGVSIPLWENKNTVKYARAQTEALENVSADNRLQFYNRLKTIHAKTVALQKSVEDYSKELENFNNAELLKKALSKGEINLIEYVLELSVYYNSIDKMLEMKKEMYNSLAELNQYL